MFYDEVPPPKIFWMRKLWITRT